ncbi:hypothetical protein FXB39_10360 [Nocardioides sp. BGMRC 2183]|nr:hypothetical protein FXB39_10360 [Nocardioides sp. BGMRC 2183]
MKGPLPPDDPRHGTTNGYGNWGCRCDPCREANRKNHQAYVERVRGTGQLTGEGVTHGTAYRYQMGCRCEECREARNKKSREDKRRKRQERRSME